MGRFTVFLISALISFSLMAQIDLTKDEVEALLKLDIDEAQLKEMIHRKDLTELKEKLSEADISDEGQVLVDDLKDDLRDKGNEIKDQVLEKIEDEKNRIEGKARESLKELEKDAEKVAGGYAASTVSLIGLAVFAPAVLKSCTTKPSALIYAGAGAVYVTKELLNSQKFKAEALSEIEYVELKLDQSRSLAENIATSKEAFNLQFDLINRYKSFVDKAIKSIDEKAKSARIAAIGFTAASAVALAETYGFDAGTCGTPVKAVPPGASNYFDLNWNLIPNFFLADAVGRSPEITVKKYTLSEDLKKSTLAKYLSDSDKIIALLAGGGSFAAASFLPWYNDLLTKIVANGTSRAVVFAANGAVAFAASKQFADAAKSMKQKSSQLQEMLDEAKKLGNVGFEIAEDVVNKKDLLDVLGIDPDLKDSTLKEIEGELKSLDVEEIQENLESLELPKDLTSWFSLSLFNTAHAQNSTPKMIWRCYNPEKCPAPQFPQLQHSSFARVNQWLNDYSLYSRAVYRQPGQLEAAEKKILAGEDMILSVQNQMIQHLQEKQKKAGVKPLDFQAQVAREVKAAERVITQKAPARAKDLGVVADSMNKKKIVAPATTKQITKTNRPIGRGISALDFNVLTGLVQRLDHLIETAPYLRDEFSYMPLHPQDVSLFDAIQHRYRIIFSDRYQNPD